MTALGLGHGGSLVASLLTALSVYRHELMLKLFRFIVQYLGQIFSVLVQGSSGRRSRQAILCSALPILISLIHHFHFISLIFQTCLSQFVFDGLASHFPDLGSVIDILLGNVAYPSLTWHRLWTLSDAQAVVILWIPEVEPAKFQGRRFGQFVGAFILRCLPWLSVGSLRHRGQAP